MKVEKRDGRIRDFDFSKIENAIKRVFNSKPVCEDVPDKFLEQVKAYFDSLVEKHDAKDPNYAMPIEEIQDIVRDFLIKKNKIKAAESFILYRKKREDVREKKSWLTKEIVKKIKANDIQNQNANVDEASFGGRMGEVNRVVMKDYALKNIVSKMARDNHENNMIYIHDLDSYGAGMHNCLTCPIDKLLENGFNTRQTDVRPAKSINTAMQLVAVLFQLQSLQQFGGVSASHLDWSMVPFVRDSFYKHYLEGLKYIDEYSQDEIDSFKLYFSEYAKTIQPAEIAKDIVSMRKVLQENVSIEDSIYSEENAKKYAIDMTTKEAQQAVEGLYHNLNTLQSRSGNQLI